MNTSTNILGLALVSFPTTPHPRELHKQDAKAPLHCGGAFDFNVTQLDPSHVQG